MGEWLNAISLLKLTPREDACWDAVVIMAVINTLSTYAGAFLLAAAIGAGLRFGWGS